MDGAEHMLTASGSQSPQAGRSCVSKGRAQPVPDSCPSKDKDLFLLFAPLADESVHSVLIPTDSAYCSFV